MIPNTTVNDKWPDILPSQHLKQCFMLCCLFGGGEIGIYEWNTVFQTDWPTTFKILDQVLLINIHLLKNPAVNNVKYWVNLKPYVNTLATKWLQFVMLSKLIGKKSYKLTFAAFAVRYYMYYDWKIWISGF